MTTSNVAGRRSEQERREHANQLRQDQDSRDRRRRRSVRVAAVVAVLAVIGVLAAMMYSSRTKTSSDVRAAPAFTLPTTDGKQVSLADYRGKNVLLFFNEGSGCQICSVQMAAIEKQSAAFKAAGITVLPIVMNSAQEILPDLRAEGVKSPYLLDDGTVTKAYGTLGKGMHPDLPGHSFVLIDKDGNQRWYGNYPSMWLEPTKLLEIAKSKLK